MLELFASQILNGLAIGQVYALIALGFSLVFGVSNLINFAQGALFMVGAFLAFTGVTAFGLPLPAAATLSVAGAFHAGHQPHHRTTRRNPLVAREPGFPR